LIHYANRRDYESAPTGTFDGGENVAGPLFPGQTQLFEGGGKSNVHKKKRRNPREHPGEPNDNKVLQMRQNGPGF